MGFQDKAPQIHADLGQLQGMRIKALEGKLATSRRQPLDAGPPV